MCGGVRVPHSFCCSDDVPILAIGPTIFHGAWCIALFVAWLVLNRPSKCHEGARYTVALAGLGFTFLANFALGIWLIHEGLKGGHHRLT